MPAAIEGLRDGSVLSRPEVEVAGREAAEGVPRKIKPNVIRTVEAFPLTGKGTGFGLNSDLISNAGRKSFQALVERVAEKGRKLTGSDLADLGFITFSAPIPPSFGRVVRHHHELTHGIHGRVLRRAGEEWMRKNLDMPERADLVEGVELEASRLRAAFLRRAEGEARRLPREVRAAGGPASEAFEWGILRDYLGWARAAQRSDYGFAMPVGRGRSPRQMWMEKLFHARGRETPGLKKLLREEGWSSRPAPAISDVLTQSGFERLWRAYEVASGVLDAPALARVREIQARMRGARWKPEMMGIREMTAEQAAEIVGAMTRGDRAALEAAGVHFQTVAGSQQRAVERAPSETVKGLEQMPRELEIFRQIQALEEVSTAREIESANRIASELPESWLRTGELLADPAKNKTVREGVDLADLSFAEFLARTHDKNGHFEDALVRIRNAESVGSGERYDGDAISKVEELSARVIDAAVKRGWLEVSKDGKSLEPSVEMNRLATEVDRAMWERAGHKDPPPRRDWHMPMQGDNSPITKICSDCATFWRQPIEVSEKQAWSGKLKEYASRLSKLLMGDRQIMQSWVSMYGAQMTRDQSQRVMNGILPRWFSSLRNRYGDPLATIAGKFVDEKGKLWSDSLPYLNKMEKLYSEVPSPKDLSLEKWNKSEEEGGYSQRIRDGVVELDAVARRLNGERDVALKTERAKQAYEEGRQLLNLFKRVASEHLFRDVRREAEKALRAGWDLPESVFRKWRHVIGEDPAARDPKVALARLRAVVDPEAGVVTDVAGMKVRSWGLTDYFPHIFPRTTAEGDGISWVEHPGNRRDGDEINVGGMGDPHEGQGLETWRVSLGRNMAREHGFMHRKKWMANLMTRFANKDGWISDPRYALKEYAGQLIDKVYHEKLVDDVDPHLFGRYETFDLETREDLHEMLSKIPNDGSRSRFGALGSVDGYFGLKLQGDLSAGTRYIRKGDKWVKSEVELDGKAMRETFGRFKNERWRWDDRMTEIGEDPASWKLMLTNSTEGLMLEGAEAIKRAGVLYRKGGLFNFQTGEGYNAVKDVVRDMAGYDMDTGTWASWTKKSAWAENFRKMSDWLNEFFYQTQLGGGPLGVKAGMVQAFEGTLQNMAAIGGKTVAEYSPDMRGAARFFMELQNSKDPATKEVELRKKYADTPFVQKILPVMDAGQWRPAHLLRTEAIRSASMGTMREKYEYAKRISYGPFSVADMLTKIQGYYSSYMKSLEQGRWNDPETGLEVEVVPDYIPLGDMYTRGGRVVSAHDLARMVVERTHFTQPRFAHPGLMKVPGWNLFGHLGTQATNISFEFMHGMFRSLPKYIQTGDQAHAWMAEKSTRYLVGLAAAYGLAGMFGRDLGEYAGAKIADVGVGPFSLGKVVPQLHGLPEWARFYTYQLPRRASLPVDFWFGRAGVGAFSTAGDIAMRMHVEPGAPIQAIGDGMSQWWQHWGRIAGLGPGTRVSRNILNYMQGGLHYTGADPERPWEVSDVPFFGPKPRVRYRSTAQLIGDLLLPGSVMEQSTAYHRSQWALEKVGMETKLSSELRRQLRSSDPEEVENAESRLKAMGYQIRGSIIERQRIQDRLPGPASILFQARTKRQRLELLVEVGADWPREIKDRAWRVVMGPDKRLGDWGRYDEKIVPRDLRRRVEQEFLR